MGSNPTATANAQGPCFLLFRRKVGGFVLPADWLAVTQLYSIRGVDVEDVERRRLLVTRVLVGDSAAKSVLEPLIGRTAPYWGQRIVRSIPISAIDAANKLPGPPPGSWDDPERNDFLDTKPGLEGGYT